MQQDQNTEREIGARSARAEQDRAVAPRFAPLRPQQPEWRVRAEAVERRAAEATPAGHQPEPDDEIGG